MENQIALNALIRKRADISGELEAAQGVVRRLTIDLNNIDAAILIFNPDYKLDSIKPARIPSKYKMPKGEASRALLGVLRNASKPVTTLELTQHVMADRGMNTSDKKAVKIMIEKVGACLRNYKYKGIISSRKGEGRGVIWEIVR